MTKMGNRSPKIALPEMRPDTGKKGHIDKFQKLTSSDSGKAMGILRPDQDEVPRLQRFELSIDPISSLTGLHPK
jgi:hypothetical protein